MATGIRRTGEFCWINMLTPRPAQAMEFFARVLGWTYFEMPGIGHGGMPFMVGTPDEVHCMLAELRKWRLTHLSLNLHQPGQDSQSVRRSMRLFANELMPSIRAW